MRCLALALAFVWLTCAAQAQDNAANLTYDMFGVPEQTIKVVKPVEKLGSDLSYDFPDCNAPELIAATQKSIADDMANISGESAISRRYRLLTLKSMNQFEAMDINTVRPQDEPELAAILVVDKINFGRHDEEFKICAGENLVTHKRVFLLLRAENDGFNVKIVNYFPHRILSFIYKKQ